MYRKAEYNVVCACCNKSFIAHDSRKRYCSRKCKDVGYKRSKGQDSRLEPRFVKCIICGAEFETTNATKITCSPECSMENRKRHQKINGHGRCRKQKPGQIPLEEYKKQKQEQARQRAEKLALEKAWYKALHTIERECEECGALFYCLDSENKKTCSPECSRRYGNRKRDKRIPKEQQVDRITLKKLYKRDEGICYLCGEKCDWNDWMVSPKGNSYPGDKYPTIEHVVPISKGGLDAWNNVRLAHWKCNLEKADGIIKMQPMTHQFAYSQKFSATQAKKTAQYSLDGELIKIWDSTGQIERELGLKSKHIQNVCRGDNSNTGNAYGFHWEYVS
jgi:5-methylcytosine-specific restriction endonuclease McrA